MKTHVKQQGFTVVEPLLVIVALAIVGFAGYYIYTANNNATDSYDAATQSVSAPVTSSSKAPSGDEQSANQSTELTTDNAKLKAAAEAANPNDAESEQELQDASGAMSEQ